VAVWRYDNTAGQFRVVSGSITPLELQLENGLLASIFCTQHILSTSSHVIIRQGDVVGVVFLSTNSIPMVGISHEYLVMTNSTSQFYPVDTLSSSLTLERLALHLYA